MIPRLVLISLFLAAPIHAQEAGIALGALQQAADLPVEVTAESLSVDQASGQAVFSGDVVVTQGEMRLSAPRVVVEYAGDSAGTGRISAVRAAGGVTLVTPTEAAEAAEALYRPDAAIVEMSGDVLLTQGGATLAGQRLVLDLADGTGRIEGGVRTIFQTGGP
jgi:lipopolysaccharide export system protein LptA